MRTGGDDGQELEDPELQVNVARKICCTRSLADPHFADGQTPEARRGAGRDEHLPEEDRPRSCPGGDRLGSAVPGPQVPSLRPEQSRASVPLKYDTAHATPDNEQQLAPDQGR